MRQLQSLGYEKPSLYHSWIWVQMHPWAWQTENDTWEDNQVMLFHIIRKYIDDTF